MRCIAWRRDFSRGYLIPQKWMARHSAWAQIGANCARSCRNARQQASVSKIAGKNWPQISPGTTKAFYSERMRERDYVQGQSRISPRTISWSWLRRADLNSNSLNSHKTLWPGTNAMPVSAPLGPNRCAKQGRRDFSYSD